jgi:hypothetical protein
LRLFLLKQSYAITQPTAAKISSSIDAMMTTIYKTTRTTNNKCVDLELNREKIRKAFSLRNSSRKIVPVRGRGLGRGNPGGFLLEEIPLISWQICLLNVFLWYNIEILTPLFEFLLTFL